MVGPGKTLAACLVAVVAIAMAAAVTAEAALPEWQKEKEALTEPLPFEITGGLGKFETPNGSTNATWTSVGGKGQIEGTNAIAKLSLIFWGSKAKEAGKAGCTVSSPSAKEGEVVTNALKGRIGYLDKAKTEVGVLFEPVTAKAPVAEIKGPCITGTLLVSGSVIGKVTSAINSEVSTVQLSFSIVSKAQQFVKFEGEKEEHEFSFGGLKEPALFDCKEENAKLTKGKVEIKA